MTDHSNALQVEAAEQRDQVRDVTVQAVSLLATRLLGQTETNHVRHNHAMAGCGQRPDKFTIQVAPSGIPVQ